MTTLFLAGLLLWANSHVGTGADLIGALHREEFAAVDAALQPPATWTPADIEAVQRDLTNPAPGIRQLAAYALSQIDPERTRQAVPALIEALQHPEPRVRARLALALAKLGPAARAAVPSLLEQLKDDDPRCRAGAARALGNFGAEAIGAVPALATLLKDTEPPVRVVASMALGQMGHLARGAAPALRAAQRTDPDAEVRAAAASALEEVDPPVALILAALTDRDDPRRLWAVSRLIDDSAAARLAISPLAQILTQDSNAGVRAGAALALGKVGSDARSAGPALLQALKDSSARVRGTAALAVGLLGPSVENSGPHLAELLTDEDPTVADAAATALGNLGQAAENAAAALVRLLGSKDTHMRRRAVNVLARIGSGARPAVTALVGALSDDNAEVRHEACRALASLGPQAAQVPVLIEALHYQQDALDASVRAWACLSLAANGPGAAEALGTLLDALHDKEANVRATAAIALARMGPTAVPALVGALDHLEPEVRAGSALALGGIGPAARRAVDSLLRAVRDEDSQVRLAAVMALGSIARGLQLQQDPDELPVLETVLKTVQEAPAPPLSSRDAEQWQAAVVGVREAVAAIQHASRAELIGSVLHNPWLATIIVVAGWVVALLVVWSLLLWLRPLTLLYLGEKLRFLPCIQVPIGVGSVSLSARELLFLRFFEHHPRVLDAWLARHRNSYRQSFEAKQTVQDRKAYLPGPITVDGKLVPSPAARDFGQAFAGRRGCLLICGEDGAGKTSLACCLARWAMEDDRAARLCDHVLLPVLIEHDLRATDEANLSGHLALVAAVRGQVQAMLPEEPAISEELIVALLRRRRIMVIVDQRCQGEASLGAIRPSHADFPAHALVVISRQEELLGGVPRTVVKLRRIESSPLLDARLPRAG